VRTIVAAVLAVGCGKQLNPEFCDAHPSDDRCLGASNADSGSGGMHDAAPLPACPSEYNITISSQPRSKYRLVDNTNDWNDAAPTCAGDLPGHTHLVVISNATELTDLDPQFDQRRFIGLSDRVTKGTYRPVTDEPVDYPALYNVQVPPWGVGQPNGSGDCVSVDVNLAVSDEDCLTLDLGFICECDDYEDNPDNY
jgi:hypothetical protein